MSVTAWNVGPVPAQVTQKANKDRTTLVNQGMYPVFLTDKPMKGTADLGIDAGYGITVDPGVELWAYTWAPATYSTVIVAEGVGPIFAAGSI